MGDSVKLNTPPRIRKTAPRGDIREGQLAVELANVYTGITLFDWQEDTLCSWMARDETGSKYVHPSCGLSMPRQNGKSKGLIVARMIAGVLFYGETISYSAHRVDVMMEVFQIVVDIFGDSRQRPDYWEFPELHKHVKRMSFQNGHLSISFKNGGRIYFVARSKGSGRGKTVDVNIIDEAQYLTQEEYANIVPSQSAAPLGNPQIILVGNPPDFKESMGEVFGTMRDNAIKNRVDKLCWYEWSVEKIGDVYDKTRWFAANPALGYTLDVETIEANELYGGMDEETFARERLGFWTKMKTDMAVNKRQWLDTRIARIPDEYDKSCIGVKFAPNATSVAISVATLHGDDAFGQLIRYETAETAQGIDWLVQLIKKQLPNTNLIAIDGKSGAEDLRNRLVKAGASKRQVHVMNTSEVVSAATMINSSLDEEEFHHVEAPVLDQSAVKSTKRKIGTDGYGFGGDSIPIESLAAAHWAVKTTTRKPGNGISKGFSHG